MIGHLGIQNLQKLANEKMVDGLDCTVTTDTTSVSHALVESITKVHFQNLLAVTLRILWILYIAMCVGK